MRPVRAEAEKRYSSPVGIFLFRRRDSASGADLGGSVPGRSPYEARFFLSHFLPRQTRSKPIGLVMTRRSCCGDARFANVTPSSVTVAAASRRTMNITTGLGSGAAFAQVVARPSPYFPCFLSPTPITAYWLGLRRCGDTSWSTVRGKRQRPRLRTPIGCPIPRPSAVGRSAWTAPNHPLPFDAQRSPAWRIG